MTTITHSRVMKIAAPIVLSNATVPLLGAVDTAVIGQLGDAAQLGAVGLGAVILATLYWAFGFLRMSTSGLAAQAHGAGEVGESAAVLFRALIIAGTAGFALVLLQKVLFAGAFMLAPASPTVEGFARQYLQIRIWGAPATIALYALTGWLVGMERTRGVLILQLWQNGLNILLSMWFVLGLGWGVPGVAFATLIAEWTGLALALWLARDVFGAGLRAGIARLRNRSAIALMFRASRNIMVRTVILQLAFTTFVFLGARFGDVTLAANQVLMQFLEVTAYALDGFAIAAETLVGQAVGAKAERDIRSASRISMQWGLGGALALTLTIWAFGPAFIDLMTTSPEVREEARHYLLWLTLAPVIGFAAWVYDGIFIGAMLTGDMLRAMLISSAAYCVALVVLVPTTGNHGLWLALMILNGTRTFTLWRQFPKVPALAAQP